MSVREKAEKNLEFILDRAIKKEGRIEQADAHDAQLFCRAIEAETNGGAYGATTYIGADRSRILAAAASSVRPVEGEDGGSC